MEQMREARLSEAIALQIAELILSGEIKSETKLRQEELAEILQVSRIPVREALQLLDAGAGEAACYPPYCDSKSGGIPYP